MTDLFQPLPELPPAWKIHAGILGIETTCSDPVQLGEAATWHARIEYFGKMEYQEGDTEQQAVNLLIYRLKL